MAYTPLFFSTTSSDKSAIFDRFARVQCLRLGNLQERIKDRCPKSARGFAENNNKLLLRTRSSCPSINLKQMHRQKNVSLFLTNHLHVCKMCAWIPACFQGPTVSPTYVQVHDTLLYKARLIMPGRSSSEALKEVATILGKLGLTGAQDTQVSKLSWWGVRMESPEIIIWKR